MSSPSQLSSFSEHGPWELDLANIGWRRDVDNLRAATRAQVPALVQHKLLPPGMRVAEVGGSIAGAVIGWAVNERRRGGSASKSGISRRMRRAFTRLGPTYIKMGQIISSGEGIFPEELVAEFRLLRDRVPAESFDDVRTIVEADLGQPLETLFSSFEREPIAAASIAQVHLAQLITGEHVAVKVQRPRIAPQVAADLRAMAWIAHHLVGRIDMAALANPPAIVELFAETIVEELDFRLEAANMLDIAQVLDMAGQKAIVVPRPHPELVTPRVLVMERLVGFTFDDVSGMQAAGIDTAAVARACMVMVMEGAMIYGVFHGDLHGGNLLVLPDGRVGLLDYGITGRLSDFRRSAFLRMLLSSMTQDLPAQLTALRDLGAFPPDADVDHLLADLDLEGLQNIDPTTMDAEELLERMRDLTKKLLGHGAKLPKELLVFMKDMMFLDGAMATLAPDVDLMGQLTSVMGGFAAQHGAQIAAELGIDASALTIDMSAMSAMGGPMMEEGATYRSMNEQRQEMRERMRADLGKRRRPWRRG